VKPTLQKLARCMALAIGMGATSAASMAACLTNNSDVVGNAVFGATVQTFVNLGINPNTTCIENSVWADPANFGLGTYVKGAEGFGTGTDPTVLGAYNGAGSAAANANGRDFAWVQDTSANANPKGTVGSAPSTGIIWNLGGQANQVAVFVFVDHGPVPGEVLENTAWLSNDPNAADAGWTQASLVHVYGGGWSPDPNIADGFVAVYQLPSAATFQYVSVTWGGPGAIVRDGDNEIDAVGGLTISGGGVGGNVPEPASVALIGLGLVGVALSRRRRA
jgi:PEP-CTERM motif